MTPTAAALAAVATVSTVALAGCGSESDDVEGDEEGVVGVVATPSDSPEATNPVGEVSQGEPVTGLVRASLNSSGTADSDAEGEPVPVASLENGNLVIGSLADLADVAGGDAETVAVGEDCTTISGTVDGVVLGCGSTVRIFDNEGTETSSVDAPGPVTSVTQSPSGTLLVSVEDSDKSYWLDTDGEEISSETMTDTADGVTLVGNTRNSDDDGAPEWRAALIDAAQSSVTDLGIEDQERKAALRIGQGVGTVSAGIDPDGVLVASDPRQGQALVYTLTDVIRHTQSVPTGDGTWAVLWDSARELMWVSTTGDNTLTAYDLSSGTPESVGDVSTSADVRHIIDDGSGDLLLITADGSRELIPADDLPRKD